MGRFSNRTAVITGAASGMGRATARRIAGEGGRVVSIDIADGGGAATVALIESEGGSPALAIECDVADPAQVEAAITAALAFTGQIDVLVNCAGTGYYSHFTEQSPADVERVMAVNFGGTFWTCRHSIEALLASRGCIVNVASAAAVRGCAYLSAYAASKGAVLAFTKSLAVEYGSRGLRANAVCPGGTDTPLLSLFTPPDNADHRLMTRDHNLFGRMLTPEEVAGTITFLASDDAAMTTGATVLVDAGSTT